MHTAEHPLTKQETTLIAAAYKALSQIIPGFNAREQQKQLIQFAARTYATDCQSVGEAPTGTGKSFGYQIPGIVLALTRDRRLVISTETANLQDQIYNNDLSVLRKVFALLGYEFTSVVAKGRERYVCPLKLEEKDAQGSLMDGEDMSRYVADIASAWKKGTWDGLRDSLPFKVPQPIWMSVNNNRHSCTNDRCPAADTCPHMDVKNRLKEARVIVTNHSYFLSTVSALHGAENAKKNPVIDFEKNYYAFDEAHHLHDRIIGSFASAAEIDEDFLPEVSVMLSILGSPQIPTFKIRSESLRGLGAALRANVKVLVGNGELHRFTLGEVPSVLRELVQDYAASVETIVDILDEAIEEASKQSNQKPALILALGNANALLGKLSELHAALEEFGGDNDHPRARWIDMKKGMCSFHAAPYEASALGHHMLWKNMRGALLTSATITSMGKFEPTLAALGLPKDAPTLKLTSPLDYSRSQIVVPRNMVDANSPGHGVMMAALLRVWAFSEETVGTLVYFTSKKKMEAVYAILTPEERATVIMQTNSSPSAMVEEHKRRIDAGGRSVMFGMDSISEGVDLPLHYCTLVVVDKLPFPSPDDPILASHSEYLESKGLAPFPLLMLPRAARKLAQVIGRLNRTENDWGRVIVMDRRLVEKKYGAQLLQATPFCQVAQI